MLLRNWLDGFLSRFSSRTWRRSHHSSGRPLKNRKTTLRSPEALEVRTLLSAATATFKLQTGGANPLNGQDAGTGCTLTIGDITGDGLADVIVGRKAGNFGFYKNTGTAAIPAYTLQSGVANPLNGLTVGAYSAPALGDLNGDGLLDLISGVSTGTFVYYLNTGTASNPAFTLQASAANPLNGVDIGISSIPTLGDLNGDGLLDLIAGNDAGTFTYFKNTGTATTPIFTQQSGAANPLDGQVIGPYSTPALGDLNGDGLLDLIAGRNDGQFVYYQNTGTAANPAFTPQTGTANPLDGQDLGDYSVPALKDLNGDGRPDLLAQNLNGLFTYYMNVGPIRPTLPRQYGTANPLEAVDLDFYSAPTLGDLTGDGLTDLIAGNNVGTLSYYKNTGTRGNPIYTLQTGAANPFSGVDKVVAVPTLGDLSGDGLLDLIVGNLYGTLNYYKNTGTAASPVFTLQTGAANPLDGLTVGNLSAPTLGDLNGDGLLDLVVGNGGGTLRYYKNTGTATSPVLTLQSGAAYPLNGQFLGNVVSLPTLGDLNGDGLLDLTVGNNDGTFTYYQNTGSATNPGFTAQQDGWNPLNGQDLGGRSPPALADLNGDGALDLLAGKFDGKFAYYKNVPVPIVPRLVPQTGPANPLNGQDIGYAPAPALGDITGDGLPDLIIGDQNGTFTYYKNTGNATVPAFTLQTGAANPLNGQNVRVYSTPTLGDLNGDGLLDLIVGDEYGTFTYYKNTGNASTPAFTLQTGAANPLNGQVVGTFSAPTLADLNGDGLLDLIVGNKSGTFSYFKNTGTVTTPAFTLQTGAANPLDGQAVFLYSTPTLEDVNGDGLVDLLVGQGNGTGSYFKNTGTRTVPVFTLLHGTADPLNGVALPNFPTLALKDLDADGHADLIVGGQNGMFSYYRSLPQTAPVLNPTIHPQVNISEDIAGPANSGLLISDIITTTFGSDNWYDVDAAAAQGIAIIATDNSLGIWQCTANGTTWTDVGNPAASSAFLLANNANTRIRFRPNANANGTISNGLTFVAWDQTTGSNLGSADASLRGGATAFSSASATINLTINAVNDPPVLNAAGNPTLPTIAEDNTTTTGILVSDLIASMGPLGGITDPDVGALQGITIIGYGGIFQSWQYSLDNGGSWNGFPTTFPYNVLLASDANTRIRYLPPPNDYGSFAIRFRAWDQTSGVNGETVDANTGSSAFSFDEETAFITVTPVNDAPVLNTTGNPSLPTIAEDAVTNPGILVSGLITSMGASGGISDVDGGAVQGIASTAEDGSHGTWQYSLDNGGSWTVFPTGLSNSSALLLASNLNTRLRFLPALNYYGSATISFRAWDQTSGVNGGTADASINGGTTAFSSGSTESATITITAVNDAPVLNNAGNPILTPILPDTPDASNPGTSIIQIIANLTATGGSISDPDANPQGLAVSSVDNSHGTWQFTTNNGTTWTDFGTPSATSARLLAALSATKMRFKPAPGYVGTATFLFVAWDQTAGTNGGTAVVTSRGGNKPCSLATDTGSIGVNHAPEMTATGSPTLTPIPKNVADADNTGTTVTQLIAGLISSGGSYTEADTGSLQGIAVTSVDNAHGTWQFTTNNGTTWTDFGTTSVTTARLLIATASTKIRFKPNTDYLGNATFLFVAWDVSTGTNGSIASASNRGGARPYSLGYDTATISVIIPNIAPLLNAAGNPTLTNISKNIPDASNTGTLVSQIIANLTATGGSITDGNPAALQGIAVTSAVQINGTWQYSIDGTTWLNFATPAVATARLLAADANTRIRFKPNAGYTGTATFLFVAWDQSSGTNGGTLSASKRGGLTPFSLNTDTASITVTQ